MIGKIPKAGRGFKGLVSYLLRGPGRKERQDAKAGERQDANTTHRQDANRNRVLWTDTCNLLTANPEQALRIMRATANRSVRCKAPVYHFVISWSELERPDFATIREVVDHTCRDMGLDELQRIAIAHDDKRHRHVHVVVNRVHPETGKAWNRRQDWVRLERSLARQARARGLKHVPGRHNDPAAFREKARKAPDREYQMARRKGEDVPLLTWCQARLVAERPNLIAAFNAADSWDEIHAAVAKLGYRLEAKGGGLVIRDDTSELKLSLVAKGIRLKALEDRCRARFTQGEILPPERAPALSDEKFFLADDRLAPKRDLKSTISPNTDQYSTYTSRTDIDSEQPARKHEPVSISSREEGEDDDTPTSPRRRRGRSR